MLVVTNVCENYELGKGGHRGSVIVFISKKRPFEEGKIIEDFTWRRTHQQPYKNEEILEVVKDELEKRKVEVSRINYNRKAGCTLCPCSPGYVIYDRKVSYPGKYRLAIWLEETSNERT